MNKFTYLLVIFFLISLFSASAQLDLPPPPQAPSFETQEPTPPEPQLPAEVQQQQPQVQTPQPQQLQAQVSSLQATVETLSNENQRLKQELRLQAERRPRTTTFFYIIFFLSLAVNIFFIVVYVLKYTKHRHEEPEVSPAKGPVYGPRRPAKRQEYKKEVAELKDYLLKAAKQGLTFDEVHKALKEAGWPEDLIEKAYDEIQHGL